MASSVSGWRRVEQHQHEVGDALEPVELRGGLHRPEPTAARRPVIAAAHPFDWHLHLVWLLALAGARGRVYLWATRRQGCGGDDAPEAPLPRRRRRPRRRRDVAARATWPRHWLLLALVLQRLLLTLAVPPLLVLGTPRPLIARLTRPPAVDAVLRVVVRPLPAVAIVTVVAVATLTTGAVSLAARSDVARVVIELRRARLGLRAVGAGADRAPGDAAPLGARARAAISSCSRSCRASSPSSGSSPGTRLYPPFTHTGQGGRA